jgi:hypothetical protein
MAFPLPSGFAKRVDDLDLYLREEAATPVKKDKDRLLRLALVTACALLDSVDDNSLEVTLKDLLSAPGAEVRKLAKLTLQEDRAFEFFLERIENGLLEVTGIEERTRKRILVLLREVRSDAIQNLDNLRYVQIVRAFRELRTQVCELKNKEIAEADEFERSRQRDEAHTRIVNTFGTVSILVNAAAAFAAAGSLLFLPAVALAACAASAALGSVAQSRKPK